MAAYLTGYNDPASILQNLAASEDDDLVPTRSYARYRKDDPRLHPFKGQVKIEDGMPDLGELELHNRSKYGVKKPANVWAHEMDDNRICGFQIRTSNFKSSMFEKDKPARLRAPQ